MLCLHLGCQKREGFPPRTLKDGLPEIFLVSVLKLVELFESTRIVVIFSKEGGPIRGETADVDA